MSKAPVLDEVKSYFDKCIKEHGASPRGSDWNSDISQNIRFDQVLKVIQGKDKFSLIDFGCGYGALADYLAEKEFQFTYYGYDLLESAIEVALQAHAGKENYHFSADEATLPLCDYTVASGIFNFRGKESFEIWTDHIIKALHSFDKLSKKGFSSNFLTKYSDADKMRDDLYYADPLFIFDYCKKNFSRNVALLHDYQLYDFTIIVRKE